MSQKHSSSQDGSRNMTVDSIYSNNPALSTHLKPTKHTGRRWSSRFEGEAEWQVTCNKSANVLFQSILQNSFTSRSMSARFGRYILPIHSLFFHFSLTALIICNPIKYLNVVQLLMKTLRRLQEENRLSYFNPAVPYLKRQLCYS